MTEGTYYPNWTCPHCGGKSFTVTYLGKGGGSIKCDNCGATGGGSLTKKTKTP